MLLPQAIHRTVDTTVCLFSDMLLLYIFVSIHYGTEYTPTAVPLRSLTAKPYVRWPRAFQNFSGNLGNRELMSADAKEAAKMMIFFRLCIAGEKAFIY